MTPTAQLADIVLPVTTPFESEALKIGFEYSHHAAYRHRLAPSVITPEEPRANPVGVRVPLTTRYPLVLSRARSLFFCETQHRQIAALRMSAPDPHVELHPTAAAARGISAGDWTSLDTPRGRVRACAKLNANLDPGVVFGS